MISGAKLAWLWRAAVLSVDAGNAFCPHFTASAVWPGSSGLGRLEAGKRLQFVTKSQQNFGEGQFQRIQCFYLNMGNRDGYSACIAD
jgi:hypothetical protein